MYIAYVLEVIVLHLYYIKLFLKMFDRTFTTCNFKYRI